MATVLRFEPPPGPLALQSRGLVLCYFQAATPPEPKEKHGFFISPERIRARPVRGRMLARAVTFTKTYPKAFLVI